MSGPHPLQKAHDKNIPLTNKLPYHSSPNTAPQHTIQRRVSRREQSLGIAVVGHPFLQCTRLRDQTLAYQFRYCLDFEGR